MKNITPTMNEPMDREELIEAIERTLDWMSSGDDDNPDILCRITLDNASVQRSLKEARGFCNALRALQKEPHGV